MKFQPVFKRKEHSYAYPGKIPGLLKDKDKYYSFLVERTSYLKRTKIK